MIKELLDLNHQPYEIELFRHFWAMRLCYLNLWLVLCTTVLAHKLWQFVPWNSEINDCLPSDSTLCTLAISEICPEQKIFHGIRVSKCLISESLINKKRVHWSWKKTKKRKKERIALQLIQVLVLWSSLFIPCVWLMKFWVQDFCMKLSGMCGSWTESN